MDTKKCILYIHFNHIFYTINLGVQIWEGLIVAIFSIMQDQENAENISKIKKSENSVHCMMLKTE